MELAPAPLVSVIVPALDAGDTIERCVRSLIAQSWPALELIVVDNGSRDSTADLARRAGARVVGEALRGRSRARNRGVAEARGTLFGFLDADCEAPADWIERSVAALRQPWLAAVQALVQKSTSAPPGRGFVQAHYHWPFLDTCALMTTRFACEAAGGFDEQLTRNEDMDFSFRLLSCGFAFAWLPDVIVLKLHDLNAGQALRRGWVGGQSLAVLFGKWHAQLGISHAHFYADLGKGAIKAALRDAGNLRSSRGIASLEALGRWLGCLQAGISLHNVTATERAVVTSLADRLGGLRFPVVGPDETLLFDAENQRLRRLNSEQARALERYIEDSGTDLTRYAPVIREFGLSPRERVPLAGE